MNKLSFYIFLFAFLLKTGITYGQIELGFSFGQSIAKQTLSNPEAASIRYFDSQELSSSSASIYGFSFGLSARKRINDNFDLQGQLLYTQKGQDEEITHEDFRNGPLYLAATYTDEINYLTIPIRIAYKISPIDFLELRLNAGTYLGFGVGGTTTYEVFEYQGVFYTPPRISEGSVFFRSGVSSRDDYEVNDLIVKPFDFGLATGFELNVKWFGLFVDYQLGLNNVHAKIDNVRSNSNDMEHNNRRKQNRTLIFGLNLWPLKFDKQ